MNELDLEKNELFLKFAEEDKEFERKINANIELSPKEYVIYLSRILETGEIYTAYRNWKNEQFINLTLFAVVKNIAAKTISINEEKYERQYQDFLERLSHATNFGKKESEIYQAETAKWYNIIENPRNGLLIQLGNEKVKNVGRKVEAYIQMLGLKEAKDKNLDDDFEVLVNPTPNQLTEKEIELDEYIQLSDEHKLFDAMKRGENLGNDLVFLVKSISKDLIDLNFQKEYFGRIKDLINLEKDDEKTLEIENSNGLSIAQKVLSIMIIHKFYPFSKSQDRINLQNFIHVLTGNKHRKIGDFMAKFNDENNYILHLTKKQNIEDYIAVKKYFEKMESKEIIQFIDNQLIMINKRM
jgi:hypothetical protein